MERKDFEKKKHNNTEDLSDLNITTDENAAGTSFLKEPVEDESELEKLKE
jgi:hypothetical protein